VSESGKTAPLVLDGRGLKRDFKRNTGEIVHALDDVSFKATRGTLTALVGPDGAGKTTLIRTACGLISPDAGTLTVLGFDCVREAQQIQDRVGYMPQRFGLYDDLTVQENLDLYADLHGVDKPARAERYPRLMEMTSLGAFTRRLAGDLSGGMKQKLGLACALVRAPGLLLLDEPTAGVDPLSRHELWQIIFQLVHDEQTTLLIATSYLDEAERCGHVVVMHEGKVLAQGPPGDVSTLALGHVFTVDPPEGQSPRGLQARLLDESGIVDAVPDGGHVRFVRRDGSVGTMACLKGAHATAVAPRFEDGFMMMLRDRDRSKAAAMPGLKPQSHATGGDPVVEVRDLVRMFGNFTAVDHISFAVKRGEVFGLLGPNGAGKTTTFRMLCGLLPVTSGTLRVAGLDLRTARASARGHIGYVAQKFSLYGELSVTENLEFFASAYGLSREHRRARIQWALEQFELEPLRDLPSAQLPGGFKQRLAMAAALLHEPETLFLDEPTSGADPLARREFWRRITALAEAGSTVVITTHFMEEAEYCDRVVILDQGRILAQGQPSDIRKIGQAQDGHEPTMEDAFIAIVEKSRDKAQSAAARGAA
jgi:ABC-2 type transport system ATP-binding protein